MLDNILINCHSSIKIVLDKIIYFDPFCIDKEYNDADYIFITHPHYDHFSREDIEKVINKDTKIILPESICNNAIDIDISKNKIIKVNINEKYIVDKIKIYPISAYNLEKGFHQKTSNWIGYVIQTDNTTYYIAGDTDMTNENKLVSCDVAFIPIGGEYTMDYVEAAKLTNIIKPKFVIPTHYGKIVGDKKDAEKFKQLVDKNIQCLIKIQHLRNN